MVFQHQELRLVDPRFGSELVSAIVELEAMRRRLRGTTSPELFFDLKGIFQMMESLGSSRIEGNRTTVADLIDARVQGLPTVEERLKEISNIEAATDYIEQSLVPYSQINHTIICEAHHLIVEGLDEEGDPDPGRYRNSSVSIAGSEHTPPHHSTVRGFVDELIDFINNEEDNVQYSLLRVAMAHHRFAWIHPFRNGNGRVVRLLTYAMLIQQGFNVAEGRIINPSAVFFSDRNLYYQMLAIADTGTDEALLEWCEYVLMGLHRELEKIDSILEHQYLLDRILSPAIKECAVRGEIDSLEEQILLLAARKQVFALKDLVSLKLGPHEVTLSKRMTQLRKNDLLRPSERKKRHYRLHFANNALMRSVVNRLQIEGFFTGIDEFDVEPPDADESPQSEPTQQRLI